MTISARTSLPFTLTPATLSPSVIRFSTGLLKCTSTPSHSFRRYSRRYRLSIAISSSGGVIGTLSVDFSSGDTNFHLFFWTQSETGIGVKPASSKTARLISSRQGCAAFSRLSASYTTTSCPKFLRCFAATSPPCPAPITIIFPIFSFFPFLFLFEIFQHLQIIKRFEPEMSIKFRRALVFRRVFKPYSLVPFRNVLTFKVH